jgi:glycosyltransferase involved in cell wall biosynthesis
VLAGLRPWRQVRPGAVLVSDTRPRVLVIPNAVFFPPYPDELRALQADGTQPSAWISDVDADIQYLDQRLLTEPPRWLRIAYRRLPVWAVQVLEAYRVGKRYDVVFCWSVADVALVLASLLKLTRRRMPVVALLTRVSEPKKAVLLKRVHSHLARIILPPAAQRAFAVSELGVPADKLVALPWTLDTEFWRERGAEPRTTISAAGGEMRDYATLVAALADTDIPCHIAGVLDTERRDWWNADDAERAGEEQAPQNVTFGTMPPLELRALYERSRFVVVPLQATSSDNGITSMNEAWAMGRAVIVSAVEGQRDAFEHGVEGLWVPQGDVAALRRAIVDLWNDPERAEAMGRRGRALAERRSHAVFSEGVTRVLSEVAADRAGREHAHDRS